MVKTRFRFGDIAGIVPAIDVRGSDKVYVIEEDLNPSSNKNFYFNSKGPISGYGTRLIASGQVIENAGGVVQSITLGSFTFLFTSKGAYILSDGLQYTQTWIQLIDLSGTFSDIANKDHLKWTAAFCNANMYFCHPVYGFYKLVVTATGPELQKRTSIDIKGLPGTPQAVAETNGRLIVLGINTVGWSGPNSAEDFDPALGGAGFQVLADLVPGVPMTLAGFPIGFIVWTEQGCLSAEFIGGDSVFRFDRITTEQLPLNAHAVESMPDGTQIMCTKQGLFRINNASEPEKITPVFSEFIRQFLEHEPGIHVRITYQSGPDICYVQIRDWTNHYVRTFDLAVTLDKWGLFSERHLGFIKYLPQRDSIGFVNSKGIAHHFVDFAWNREVTPHVFTGLNSQITFGYVKPPELQNEIDTLHEMQEIFIGGFPARPSWSVPEYIDLGRLPFGFGMGEFILTGFPVTSLVCETSGQTPVYTLSVGLTTAQMNDNYDSNNALIDPVNWWNNNDTTATGINYDTGEIITMVTHDGDYTEPDYYTNTNSIQVIQSDGSLPESFACGPIVDTHSTTHYQTTQDGLAIDRHNGDVWMLLDWFTANGLTLVRAVKDDNYQFQANSYSTVRGQLEHLEPDVGLGQFALILGFTTTRIIILTIVDSILGAKLETIDKDSMSSIASHYIENSGIETGAWTGRQNFCVGSDGFIYHATSNIPADDPLFANGTHCIFHRYNPETGAYVNITPWSNLDLPIDDPAATADNIQVKGLFYCRATNRIIIIFVVRIDNNDPTTSNFIWGFGAYDLNDFTWTIHKLPQTGKLDIDFNETSGPSYWYVNAIAMIDVEKNFDALPMATPCQEYFRTLEWIWRTESGDFVPLQPNNDHATSGVRIVMRDPTNNYAVLDHFEDIGTRYDTINADFGAEQFLRSICVRDTQVFGANNQLTRMSYLPNRKYFIQTAGTNSSEIYTYWFDHIHAYDRDWNLDFGLLYQFLEP